MDGKHMSTSDLKLQYLMDAAKSDPVLRAACDGADQFVARVVAESRVQELEARLRARPSEGADGKPVLGQNTPKEPMK